MDPLGGIRSSAAQGKALGKGVTGKLKRAKALKAKAAKIDKSVILHLLLFFGMGVLLGFSIFLPYYGVDTPFGPTPSEDGETMEKLNMVKVVFISLAVSFLLLGLWHINRAERKIDWMDEYRFGPEFVLTNGAALLAALGLFLMHRSAHVFPFIGQELPYFEPYGTRVAFLFASTSIWFIFPFLFKHLFQRALAVQEKRYPLWYYPKTYNEREPEWTKPIVHLHMQFTPDPTDGRTKLIETKLPLGWNFGQGIYLFMEDYNEHRSPDAPIKDLRKSDNSLGWLFSVPRKVGPFKLGKRYLDPELTVGENSIDENMEIRFKRIIRPVSDHE